MSHTQSPVNIIHVVHVQNEHDHSTISPAVLTAHMYIHVYGQYRVLACTFVYRSTRTMYIETW